MRVNQFRKMIEHCAQMQGVTDDSQRSKALRLLSEALSAADNMTVTAMLKKLEEMRRLKSLRVK